MKFLSVALIFASSIILAQNDLRVELLDSETSESVSFATIRFQGTSQGLIADYNGQFRLPKKIADTISVLEITSMGYESLEVKMDSLNPKSLNVLKMKPQLFQLQTVVLQTSKRSKERGSQIEQAYKKSKFLSAEAIVRKAVNSIKLNLSKKPHAYIGYYRDYQVLKNGNYYNLNEAILEIFDGGVMTNKLKSDDNQAVIYSYVANQKYPINLSMSGIYDEKLKYINNAELPSYGGNELTILNIHNPIRLHDLNSFSFVYTIKDKFLLNHKFSKGEISFFEDEPILSVEIKKNQEMIPNIYSIEGEIKISLLDFSIYAFDYKVFDKNKNNPVINTAVEYQRIKGKMYLNYLTFNNRFFVKDDDEFREETISYDKGDNSFKIVFNRGVDVESVKKRNFKISFQEKRLKISKVKFLSKTSIRLLITDEAQVELESISEENSDELKLEIKRVTDTKGREIYEKVNIMVYQFREYFVQETFENKSPSEDLFFVDKTRPLWESQINYFNDIDRYIINSPLMNRKM